MRIVIGEIAHETNTFCPRQTTEDHFRARGWVVGQEVIEHYTGIRSDIGRFDPFGGSLPCPVDRTTALAATKTRLERMPDELQERLINWGYAACDAAMRTHVVDRGAPPARFPYPERGVG